MHAKILDLGDAANRECEALRAELADVKRAAALREAGLAEAETARERLMSECLQLRSVLRAAAAPGAADASDSGATAAAASQSAALLLWQVQQQAARLGEGSLSRGVEGALCCQLAELLAENAQLHERLLGAAPTPASQPPSRRPSAVSFDATPASLPPSRRPSAALSPWTSPAAARPGARPLSHSEGDAAEPVAEMMRRRTSSGAKPFGRYGIDADGRPAGLQPLRRDSNGLAPSRLEAIASAGAMPSPSRNTVT